MCYYEYDYTKNTYSLYSINKKGKRMLRKSILNKVLLLNLTITLLLALLFAISNGLYAKQLTTERYNLANTTLSKLNKDFQFEIHRLDALLTLCIQDPSIVFTISDKLDSDFFLSNAQESSEKMALMRQSLPYAKMIFLYTNSSQRVVQDNGALYTKEDFIQLVLNTPLSSSIYEFGELSDGLYQYSSTIGLYIKQLHRHGCIGVLIDLTEFANINKTMGDNFGGYVIQKDGTLIISDQSLPLSDEELDQALSHDFVTLSDAKYYCVSSSMNVIPYTGLVLINNDSLMQPLQYMRLVMLITFGVLLASSLLLILLNYKIYLPLRKFTAQFGDSAENEIAIIENQIHELLCEINTLRESSHDSDLVPEKIALHYLISGGTYLPLQTLECLEQSYPYYMLFALAIQSNSGEEDLPFARMVEKELTGRFSVKFINIFKYNYSFIARPQDKEEILSLLKELTSKFDNTSQLFAGIRNYCTDIKELYTEYQAAKDCLLSSVITENCHFSWSESTNPPEDFHLSPEVRHRIFEYARNKAISHLTKELELIFYPPNGCSLIAFRSCYHDILSIYEKVCLSLNIFPPHPAHETELYNTEYMYQKLLSLMQEFFSSRQSQSYDMKKQMEEYIAAHLSDPLSLDIVADTFSITPVYLSSWFKKNMGTNFLSYISNARMQYATELLCQNNPPKIYEIATAVGIENTTTFIRQFKKYTGITPSQSQKNAKTKELT